MPHTNISQDAINKAFWAACDTFRGTVDPSIYKDFIDPKVKRHVQAFYGLFPHHLGESTLPEDDSLDYALRIDEVVTAAVAEYSINPQEIENQTRRQLIPLLFKAIGMDKTQAIITDVIKITRLGVTGHH